MRSDASDIQCWPEKIRQRYENYLKTSFFFKQPELRASFQTALQEEGSLLKGPYPESARGFKTRLTARALARECFLDECEGLLPALIDRPLYVHQERAVRATHIDGRNVVVGIVKLMLSERTYRVELTSFALIGRHRLPPARR